MLNDLRWEVIVSVTDFGEIAGDHHRLNFLFMISTMNIAV